MSRQPTTTALPRLVHWLLVVATLAGLSISQGGHCTNVLSAGLDVHRDFVSASLAGHGPVAERVATILPGDAQRPSPSRHDAPSTTATTCRDLPATVSGSAGAAATSPPAGVRTAIATPCVPLVKDRPLPAVTLARIGVSRT